MNTKFMFSGMECTISDDGYLGTPEGVSAYSLGSVGLQIVGYPLGSDAPSAVIQAFLKPSQARAFASAILSAATEARAA